ncbi:FixH family protein [Paenibacillus faecalis]|uniref:FixH family protein n=1 Tax=Paenibacillus faecalis TaxID=2079532 RepID=UPI003B3B2299
MLKKKSYALISVMVMMAIALAACGDSKDDSKHQNSMEGPLTVELSLNAETAAIGEKVIIQAKVTHSGEPVEDADSVEFEIISEDGGMKEKVPVQHSEDGNYELEKTFTEPGMYRIISHVTAREQHSMPSKELKITK